MPMRYEWEQSLSVQYQEHAYKKDEKNDTFLEILISILAGWIEA